jgi:putative membrane protein
MIKVSVKHLPLWLALAVPLAGCETAASQISSSGTMGSADADFVAAAYSIAQLDEQAGKLAATKAADPRVINLAGQMSAEAQVLYPNLQGALRVEGKPAPTSPPPQVTAEVQTLSGLKGSAFDKQFVADELAAHKQAVAILQKEEAATKDGAMKNQVETELPAVQGNLATLQVLSSSLSPSQSS